MLGIDGATCHKTCLSIFETFRQETECRMPLVFVSGPILQISLSLMPSQIVSSFMNEDSHVKFLCDTRKHSTKQDGVIKNGFYIKKTMKIEVRVQNLHSSSITPHDLETIHKNLDTAC